MSKLRTMALAAAFIGVAMAAPVLAAEKAKAPPPAAAPAAQPSAAADRLPGYQDMLGLAQKGDPVAQNNVAVMLATGQGVAQNYKEAAKWYEKAAQQGFAVAQGNLGQLYEKGWGVPRDPGAAAVWYQLAADQGDEWSQLSLGQMHANHMIADPDMVAAYAWLTLASKSKTVELAKQAGEAMKAVKPRLKPAQLKEAESRAKNWRPSNR
jgi:TPR repeat protein